VSTVWITHPVTGGVVEVPAEGLPMYRQSGWELLPDKELAKREKAAAAETTAAEKAMAQSAAVALGQAPAPPTPPDDPETDAPSTKKENG
jgi:hypothetical protein